MKREQRSLRYQDFALSTTVEDILKEDFWVFRGYNAAMFAFSEDPIKFSAAASCYLRKGHCLVQLSLRQLDLTAPAIVTIREGEILQLIDCSEDLEVDCCVMSKRFIETLFGMMTDLSTPSMIQRAPEVALSPEDIEDYNGFYELIDNMSKDPKITRMFPCMLHTVLAFYYKTGHKAYAEVAERGGDAATRLTESFLYLVQHNFREHQFLDFYADALGITSKHLWKVIKRRTGLAPASWIDRYVILEAKVLLRSSNLTVQQISDSLHFSSPSFFSKHFKKYTGHTPGEYRNGAGQTP